MKNNDYRAKSEALVIAIINEITKKFESTEIREAMENLDIDNWEEIHNRIDTIAEKALKSAHDDGNTNENIIVKSCLDLLSAGCDKHTSKNMGTLEEYIEKTKDHTCTLCNMEKIEGLTEKVYRLEEEMAGEDI